MNNVIIGTAGHVDHGKTCLIRALTGMDTDRLKEEKQRGITIELGFADMKAPDGTDIGIIDVPGHERFIRNMLAGIGGIDLVLFIVAADEGVMPQTVEHLDILKLLNIKKGIIVITKSDLADESWLALVEEDIRAAVNGTFLEDAPAIAVSANTAQGIEELKAMIFQAIKDVREKNNNPALLRIPMDRVFTISGFGTVVTGTLMQGMIKTGQAVTIYPQMMDAKVRNIQVHGNMVDAAYAGQRTAVNLTGIKKEDLKRGNVLAAENSLSPTMMLDVKLSLLSDSKRELSGTTRLHLYLGADEVLCNAVLLDKDELLPGESCYAQLRLEETVAVKQGDFFVVRYYSPVETIGGGVVLNANPAKHKRGNAAVIEALKIRESGDDGSVLEQALKDGSKEFAPYEKLGTQVGFSKEDAKEHLLRMVSGDKAVQLSDTVFVHMEYVEAASRTALAILHEYHKKTPLSPGMPKEEFRNKLSSALYTKDVKNLERLIDYLADTAVLSWTGNVVCAGDFSVVYTKAQRKLMDEIEKQYKEAAHEPPDLDAVLSLCKDKTEGRQILMAIWGRGVITKLSPQVFMDTVTLNGVIERIKQKIAGDGSITLAELRDMLGTSRKFALQILDYCDAIKLTRLVEDKRIFY